MKQEAEKILLQDLCARLPYGVKCRTSRKHGLIRIKNCVLDCHWLTEVQNDFYEIKPYLFPLSSMTEEQRKEISKRYNYHNYYGLCIEITNHSEGYWDDDNSCDLQDYLWLVDWYNKNHFDYRGLIPMGLAIDCTNLNIY